MKESEIPGLDELKAEYENKLKGVKEYQELTSEFDKATLGLIKEAMRSKGIVLERSLSDERLIGDKLAGGNVLGSLSGTDSCGVGCTHCITWCTPDCVMKA